MRMWVNIDLLILFKISHAEATKRLANRQEDKKCKIEARGNEFLQRVSAHPFDPTQIGAIERAIQSANLGLNPSNDGKVVRVPVPALTDERRKEMSRIVHTLSEEGRNSVRSTRRHVNDALKKLLKAHEISEDDERRALDDVQTVTDEHIQQINALQKAKDAELLEH